MSREIPSTHRSSGPRPCAWSARAGANPRKFAADLGCSDESTRTWLEQADPDAGGVTIHMWSGQQFYSLP